MSQTEFTQQKMLLELHEKALEYVDKLLPTLPAFAPFEVFSVYKLSKRTDLDEDGLHKQSHIIEGLLVKLNYAKTEKGFWYELTDVGREAKKAGGYYLYEEELKRKEERNNRKETADLSLKELALKFKFVAFGVPVISLLISLSSLGFSLYKSFQPTPQLKPQQLKLDFKLSTDNLQKTINVDTTFK